MNLDNENSYINLCSIANIYGGILKYNLSRKTNTKHRYDNLDYKNLDSLGFRSGFIPEHIRTDVANDLAYYFKHPEIIDFTTYKEKVIKEDNKEGQKERLLRIPQTKNLLAQYCLNRIVLNKLNDLVPNNSYSSRIGLGGDKMAKHILSYIKNCNKEDKKKGKEEPIYCLYMDIQKFYENIDHEILLKKLRPMFSNDQLFYIVEKLVRSMPNGKGIPIGNATSHLFGNFYLADTLNYVNNNKEKYEIGCATVYMDNWTILSRNKKKLHELEHVLIKMFDDIGLTVKPDRQVFLVNDTRGVQASGKIIFRHKKPKLYRRTWYRIAKTKKKMGITKGKNQKNFPTNISPHTVLSFMSRYGQLLFGNNLYRLLGNRFNDSAFRLYVKKIASYACECTCGYYAKVKRLAKSFTINKLKAQKKIIKEKRKKRKKIYFSELPNDERIKLIKRKRIIKMKRRRRKINKEIKKNSKTNEKNLGLQEKIVNEYATQTEKFVDKLVQTQSNEHLEFIKEIEEKCVKEEKPKPKQKSRLKYSKYKKDIATHNFLKGVFRREALKLDPKPNDDEEWDIPE